MKTVYFCLLFLGLFTLEAMDIVTKSGTTYTNAEIINATAAGLLIMHSNGGATITYADLPDDLRHQYQNEETREKAKAAENEKQKALNAEKQRQAQKIIDEQLYALDQYFVAGTPAAQSVGKKIYGTAQVISSESDLKNPGLFTVVLGEIIISNQRDDIDDYFRHLKDKNGKPTYVRLFFIIDVPTEVGMRINVNDIFNVTGRIVNCREGEEVEYSQFFSCQAEEKGSRPSNTYRYFYLTLDDGAKLFVRPPYPPTKTWPF